MMTAMYTLVNPFRASILTSRTCCSTPRGGEEKARDQQGAGGSGKKKKLRDFRKSSSRQLINKKSGRIIELDTFYPSSSCICGPSVTLIREGKRKGGNIIPVNRPELKQAGAPCLPTCRAQKQERIAAFFASMTNGKKKQTNLADLPTMPQSLTCTGQQSCKSTAMF